MRLPELGEVPCAAGEVQAVQHLIASTSRGSGSSAGSDEGHAETLVLRWLRLFM